MEGQGAGSRRCGGHLRHRAVPAVADGHEAGSVVSERRGDDLAGPVLCHGDLSADLILRHGFRRPAWFVALPEFV